MVKSNSNHSILEPQNLSVIDGGRSLHLRMVLSNYQVPCSPGWGLINGYCQMCPAGTIPNVKFACDYSPPGSFSPFRGSIKYIPCESAMAFGAITCSDYNLGHSEHLSVLPGYYRSQDRQVYLCPMGYYSVGSATSGISSECVDCPSSLSPESDSIDFSLFSFLCGSTKGMKTSANFHVTSLGDQKSILLDIKTFLNSSLDEAFKSWNASNAIDSWYGVSVNQVGDVVGLDLSLMQLTGSLPPSLGNLTDLTYMNMSGNSLRGALPSSILNLNNLEIIDLSGNKLSGTIGSELWSISALFLADLSYNNFFGTLADSFHLLSNLQVLWVNDNSLSGNMPPSLGYATSLVEIRLHDNSLTGSLPSMIALSNLLTFEAQKNILTGSLDELSVLSKVVTIILYNNRFASTLPSVFSASESLYELNLNDNLLFGTIPSSFDQLNNLHIFMVGHNALSGSLPSDLTSLSLLKTLSVENNDLTGTLSTSWCELPSIFVLKADHNNFTCVTACLPEVGYFDYLTAYPLCRGLQEIALCSLESALSINKHLPSEIEHEEQTYYLDVVENSSSILEYHFFDEQALRYEIYFDSTVYLLLLNTAVTVIATVCEGFNSSEVVCSSFSGVNWPGVHMTLPLIAAFPFLSVTVSRSGDRNTQLLPAFEFRIKTVVAPRPWTCRGVYAASVSQSLGPCSWFGVGCLESVLINKISLNSLALEGTIPTELGLLTALAYLDLAHNKIVGEIPETVASLTGMQYLALTDNDFVGTIPQGLSSWTRAKTLMLDSNSFSGSLPLFMGQLNELRRLDLHANQFSGEIPSEYCSLQSADVLLHFDSNPHVTCNQYCPNSSLALDSALPFCAPTQQPSRPPSASQSTLSRGAIAGIVVSILVVVLVVGALFYRQYLKSRVNLGLPVHHSIHKGRSMDPEEFEQYIGTAKLKNKEGRTALQMITQRDRIDLYEESFLYALVTNSLHFSPITGAVIEDENEHNYAWAEVVQHNHDVVFAVVARVLADFEEHLLHLTTSLDGQGRRYLDIASPRCRDAMNKSLYLHRRFELKPGPPEHKSATSLVQIATDHRGNTESNQSVTRVALKFMRNRHQFLAEISTRTSADFSNEYVLMVLESFDAEEDDENNFLFRVSSIKKGFKEYPYCLVMDVADTNLQRFILQRQIVGFDWDMIKLITKSLCSCLEHIHSKMLMNGDLKPRNVVLVNNTARLIDFEACASFNPLKRECAGLKYSSAYLPPEMFCQLPDGSIVVRTYNKGQMNSFRADLIVDLNDEAKPNSIGYEFKPASPKIDMWALGAILYLLCTGVNLFRCTVDDNLLPSELQTICMWNYDTKAEKLAIVTDKYARNLLSLLLSRDPIHRPDPSHVLSHPFISGVQPERMVGEDAVYDVFLSYRVDSDQHHVEALYNALTERGLKVWWDKICLLPGQRWEEGFCNGLVNSSCFVCLLSRNAINHPDKPWQNFCNLEEGSRCDNVLLEWYLALELRERKMIEGVFPVFIGDSFVATCHTPDEDKDDYHDDHASPRKGHEGEDGAAGEVDDDTTPRRVEAYESFTDYFGCGCHPARLPKINVSSVENKLHEHLGRQGLGLPLGSSRTVAEIVGDITANQGGFWRGDPHIAIGTIADSIKTMSQQLFSKKKRGKILQRTDNPNTSFYGLSGQMASENEKALRDDLAALRKELLELDAELADVIMERDTLRHQREFAVQQRKQMTSRSQSDSMIKVAPYVERVSVESLEAEIRHLKEALADADKDAVEALRKKDRLLTLRDEVIESYANEIKVLNEKLGIHQ